MKILIKSHKKKKMSSGETLEDLKITREEFDRITNAMKQEEFRKLFVEYCEEISDPENRKKYEEEIKQLESQRGVDCKFVHPHPGFVIKTTNGSEKVFINIAKNELVDRPSYENAKDTAGNIGMNWSLPLIQAPVRKDMDKKNQWCNVYDVIFHPETLDIAERDSRFRKMVVQTAIDAVCNSYHVDLDKTNLRFPKMAYKGMAKPTVIRKKNECFVEEKMDMGPLTDIMPPMPPTKKDRVVHQVKNEIKTPEYTTPKHNIIYRKNMEMHEYTDQIDAKINTTVPNEMIIEIHLPLLRAASEAVLDVSRTRLFLVSESPAKYKLELKLSYEVDAKEGHASFNKDKHVLCVTLPIISPKIGVPEIERTKKPTVEVLESFETETEHAVSEKSEKNHSKTPFFDSNSIYDTPDFHIVSYEQDHVKFLIETPNISPKSVFHEISDGECLVKFESLGEGCFAVAYGTVINFDELSIETLNFKLGAEMLLLELKLSGNINEDLVFLYGAPGLERKRFRIGEKIEPIKDGAVKPREEVLTINSKTFEFESVKEMKLE